MSELQQGGVFAQGAGAAASLAQLLNPISWRYLWVKADVSNQATLNVWVGAPPANRAPDFTVDPGQQRMQDNGTLAQSSIWVQSADLSAWSGAWTLDVQPIATDANTVGATTPLQPARLLGTYQTNNGPAVDSGPFPIVSGMQGVLLQYPRASSGPATLSIITNDGYTSYLQIPPIGLNVGTFVYLLPAGTGATSFTVRHFDSDLAPQTVRVSAFFVPLTQFVIAQQGYGTLDTQSWAVQISGLAGGLASIPVSAAPVPGLSVAELDAVAVGNGTTVQLIPGVAAKSITVHGWSLTSEVFSGNNGQTARGKIAHAGGATVMRFGQIQNFQSAVGVASPNVPHDLWIPGGLPAGPAGAALNLVSDAGALNAGTLDGAIYYTQQ